MIPLAEAWGIDLDDDEMRVAHAYSRDHRPAIEGSAICGCFSCCRSFPPEDIDRWTDSGLTAVCPWCDRDAVMPDVGVDLCMELLVEMHRYWFFDTVARESGGNMKVKVGDEVFSSKDQPIMVILTNKDKENIANMDPDCMKYAMFQDDWGTQIEMLDWMDT